MRRITLWVLSTISALVLLFSYRTSTMGPGGEAVATAPGPTGGGTSGSGTGTSGSAHGGASAGGSFDGSVAQTRWGPVQVRITVSNRRITAVDALQVPSGNFRDQRINQHAVPILHRETLQAQSAQIDSVSGATITSDGYRESLQAAIDAAHLR